MSLSESSRAHVELQAMLRKQIARELRVRRQTLGWTQGTLATRAAISAELVSRIERGRCLPSVATLVSLARALGATPNELLGVTDPAVAHEGLLRSYEALPETRRVEIRRIAEALVEYERRRS